MLRLKGYCFPREIVAYAVWVYRALRAHGGCRGLARRTRCDGQPGDRPEMASRFGCHFANYIKRDRPSATDKWHLDEVVIPINGRKYWLWRAVDANGDVLDILVQHQRNAKAARRF